MIFLLALPVLGGIALLAIHAPALLLVAALVAAVLVDGAA